MALFVLGGVALATGNPVTAATPTISKAEIRSNPPGRTQKQLRDVIWGMFRQEDFRRKTAPKRPLSHLWLQTETEPTHVPGLCRYDSVVVDFATIDPRADDADAPVRATGLSTRHMFAFVEPPKADFDTIVDYSHRQPSRPCSGLSRDVGVFDAPDEEAATRAYRSLMVLSDSVRAGRTLALKCDRVAGETQPCEAIVGALKIEELDSVEPCDAGDGLLCQRLSVGDRLLTITTTGTVSPGPPPGEIVSVKLDSLVTIADSVID